jgi:hypothetical protein
VAAAAVRQTQKRDDLAMERVLDPGPIPYSQLAPYRDPDLEHGLRHYGLEPDTTTYRLIELPLASITDTASMPHQLWDRSVVEAVKTGVDLPALVVFRHKHGDGWGLLDGVNRANAFVVLGVSTARAYELRQS